MRSSSILTRLTGSTRLIMVTGLAGALFTLAACGGSSPEAPTASPTPSQTPSASPTPTATVTPSSNFDAITVTGDYGKSPTVKIKAPWAIDKTRTKVLDKSDGPAVLAHTSVAVNYYGANGRTGEKFDESFSSGSPVPLQLDGVVPGFAKGLVGQHQGSRVLIAMPGKDGYDSLGGSPDIGVEVGDTLVFVVDIVSVQLAGPEGEAVKPKDGLPTVSGPTDKPVVKVPDGEPPTTLQVQPLIKGTGAKVTATDTVTIHYQWVTWSDGKVVESDYGADPDTTELSGLVTGIQKGLTGQTVGSRVLLVVPPAEGYPDGNEKPAIKKGETLVFLIDILFTQAAH